MTSKYKSALIVGGSRGVGRELALRLEGQGVSAHVVARTGSDLDALQKQNSEISVDQGDASEPGFAKQILAKVRPDLLIITAGATPKMVSFQTQNWDEFSSAWNLDVKVSFEFLSAALTGLMAKKSTIVNFSSGAGLAGSRLSGGYAGAKRMQHFMTEYAQREADDLALDLRFWSVIPKQLIKGTEKGHEAATAYASAVGKPLDAFWDQWEEPLTAERVAVHVMDLLEREDALSGSSFAVTGQGIAAL